MMEILSQSPGGLPIGVFEQVVVGTILTFLGYLTGKRVRGQDSGWERLLQAANRTVSSQQKLISTLERDRERLQDAIVRLRHEAIMCVEDHPIAEGMNTGEIRLEDL